ncbi:MAG: amino acid permease [Deltaproteobacteria bacterium]|nr:amino acid permease [Deltaproteobacteria bacterium]
MAIAASGSNSGGDNLSAGKLGMFAGVFTPSILTILGIILFLRLGFVVGSAGLGLTIVIIFLACSISVLTSVSLAAIATNMKVQGGGVYYLISRTLGVEFGGAIGVVLFFAQSISIAFYCMGFAEAVSGILTGVVPVSPEVIAGAAVIFLFLFAWLGADWATRFQFVVMVVLVAALVSFFVGGLMRWNQATLVENLYGSAMGTNFWFIFAIFFPAVTGFTQGVSMSGDLKNPEKNLVQGTFLAVGLSTIVYFAAAVTMAAAVPNETLINDYGAMGQAAAIDWLIEAGVIAATLSSAMASFLGAPRILQSIAVDRIFPGLLPFAQGVGPADNPRLAVMLSGVIAIATLFLGNLNYVAAVVSMFFLISYGLLNYATYAEAISASPSFRPRFRFFNARLSLAGALGCLVAMAAIDVKSSLVGVAVLFAIHQFLKRTEGPTRWADSQYSYYFKRIRENLLSMADRPEHPRGWRPCILAFCDDLKRREVVLKFASWIEGGSGLTTAVRIVEGEGTQVLQLRDKSEDELRKFIDEHKLEMFARVVAAPDFRVGVETLLQSFGVGNIRANMILLSKAEQLPAGENKEDGDQVRYGRELNEAMRLGCNVVVLDAQEDEWRRINETPSEERLVDVWWWGGRNSRLALLLAYLMTRTEAWNEARIRVLAPSSEEATTKTLESLSRTLDEVRIDATPETVLGVDLQKIVECSAKASMVFFPLQFREQHLLGPAEQNVEQLLDRLPVVALVAAGEEIDLSSGPEAGEVVEQAAALDAVQDFQKEAREAEENASALARVAEEKQEELVKIRAGGEHDTVRAAEAAHQEAVKLAREAEKLAAETRIKAQEAANAAETPDSAPTENVANKSKIGS